MNTKSRCIAILTTLALWLIAPFPVQAWELEGTKTISLITRDDQALAIGTVTFHPEGDRIGFAVALDIPKFKDYFLSMKEFKCLDGGVEVQCYVPYPYANPHTITPTDFSWLEHSLLFFFKNPSEFGAKLWNGLYYHMTMTDQGLQGTPKAVDLNLIAAPPDDLAKPPFDTSLQGDISPGARWIKALRIQ